MSDVPKKKRKLKPNQRRFVKEVLKGKSLTDAAKASGSKAKRAGQAGHRLMRQIGESGAGADLLDRMGLTDEILVNEYLKPLLKAYETKFFAHEGVVVSQFDVIDLGTRVRALDMAFQIKGLYKAEQQNTAGTIKCIVIDGRHRPPPRPAIDVTPTLRPPEEEETA
jgi:hypothetical protein